jgi:dihydrolipoamide dehydrogenase
VTVLAGTKAVNLERTAMGARVGLEGPEGPRQVEADQVLVVTGRTPNTDGIGLQSLGLETQRGFVPVEDFGRTAVPGVFAIGDVTDTPMLAHVASKEGEIVAEHLAGRSPQPRIPPDHVPMAVYTEPQVASFGLNARSAEAQGMAFRKATFPFRGVGKAVAIEQSEGMVTLITDSAGRSVLGAQIVGPEATELLHELLLAHTAGLPLKAVSEMIHAHPTLSESLMEAARAAEGWAIHI